MKTLKILHTSDWHLGQHFINHSREEEHRLFLQWLLQQLSTHQVDALIVAGDIFDTGTPPSYARTLYSDFLAEVAQSSCPNVIIVGGNHDSVATLNEQSQLLKQLNITVIGGKKEDLDQQVVLLKNQKGEPAGVVAAVPFLRDRDVRTSVAGQSQEERARAIRLGIKEHYEALYDRAHHIAQEHGNLPIVATGHLTTTGGSITEGVRDIYIGTLDGYGIDDFPAGFDYIALGHLHKKQGFGPHKKVRYCGTPIPLSFEEAQTPRSVSLVEITSQQPPVITDINVPPHREMLTLTGTFDSLLEQIRSLKVPQGFEPTWLDIRITLGDNSSSISLAQLNDEALSRGSEILRTIRENQGSHSTLRREAQHNQLSELSEFEVFEKRLQREGEDLSDERKKELTHAFTTIVNEIKTDTIITN